MASRFKRWLAKFNPPKEKFVWDKKQKQVTMVFDVENADKAYQLKSKIGRFLEARDYIEKEVDWNTDIDIQLVWGLIHSSLRHSQKKLVSQARYDLNIPTHFTDKEVFDTALEHKDLFEGHPYFRALDTKEILRKNQSVLKRLIIKELGDSSIDLEDLKWSS